MIEAPVIVQALIAPPIEFGDTAKVLIRRSGETEFTQLFAYFVDEIRFTPEELVGLTIEQARELHHKKDLSWLLS
jgi:hypothetical protein